MARQNLLLGFGLGLGLMYFLDPVTGRRRRKMAAQKAGGLVREMDHAIGVASRDLSHRVKGIAAEARSLVSREHVADEKLRERIRSKLGRHVSHPGSIEVSAQGGRVTLSGPVLEHEVERLTAAIATLRGVREIENRLETHKEPGDVPGLQGNEGRRRRSELLHENWAPGTRLLAAALGAGLMIRCARNFNFVNGTLGTIGFGLFARALANVPADRLFGFASGRRAIDFHKSINIDAPIERVYEAFSNYENFPRFMTHVREVKDLGNGRSRWTVAGPLGSPVQWTAVITRQEPNRVLAWKSELGSPVAHAGIIHFQSNADGTTRVHVRMSYNPPAGGAGHLAASLLGAHPRHQMDEDLLRMKTFLETGRTPHDAALAEQHS